MQSTDTFSPWQSVYQPMLFGAFVATSTVVVVFILSNSVAGRAGVSPEMQACQLLATQVADSETTLAAYLTTRCDADHLPPTLFE